MSRAVNVDNYTSISNVTPSDSADIQLTRGILIGVTGTLAVITASNETITITGLAVGVIHPLCVRRVLATGTSATVISAYR